MTRSRAPVHNQKTFYIYFSQFIDKNIYIFDFPNERPVFSTICGTELEENKIDVIVRPLLSDLNKMFIISE